jgi:hypothetical protein
MISSFTFLIGAYYVFRFKALAPWLEAKLRHKNKKLLISHLQDLKRISFGEIANTAIRKAENSLTSIGGVKILSFKHFIHFALLGSFIALLFTLLSVAFLATDFSQFTRILQKTEWWKVVFFPSILSGFVLAPIDAAIAHTLIRWTEKNVERRAFFALVFSIPLAFLLWGLGGGLVSYVSMLFIGGINDPLFLLNRVQISLLNPITGSAQYSIGLKWVSMSLVAASSALTSLLAATIFLGTALMKSFPSRIQGIAASPIFVAIGLNNWLERKSIDVPVRLMLSTIIALLFVLATIFAFLGV